MLNGFDSEGHEITGNTIQGLAPPGQNTRPAQCALHIEDTKGVKVCYNTVDGTQRGIHIAGNCDEMELKNNDIYSHQQGLFLSVSEVPPSSGGIVMGVQVRHGNRWLGQYEEAGAMAEFPNSPPGIDESLFKVEEGVPPLMPPSVEPEYWFIEESGPVNHCEIIAPVPPPGGSPFGFWVASNTEDDAGSWESKRALYLKLLENPEELQQNNTYQAFFQAQTETPLGRLATVQYLYKKALEIAPEQEDSLFQLKRDKYVLMDSLAVLAKELLPEVHDTATNVTLALAQGELLEILTELEMRERALVRQVLEDREQQILPLIAANIQIQTYRPHELSEKILLDFLLKTAIGVASPADSAAVQTIAIQEVSAAGMAAKKARMFLDPEWQDWALYQSEQDAVGQYVQEEPASNITHTEEVLLRLAPNPASDAVTISLPADTGGVLSIQSITGQTLYLQKIEDASPGIVEVPLNAWKSGLYLCIFRTHGGQFLLARLVIHRK